ncbi:MAG: hypothetical protein R3C04_08915 [Hyphomonas sp.]
MLRTATPVQVLNIIQVLAAVQLDLSACRQQKNRRSGKGAAKIRDASVLPYQA